MYQTQFPSSDSAREANMSNESQSKRYPETLHEAFTYATDHEATTGQQIETVPNPDKGIYFNLTGRTMHRLAWDEAGNIVEIVSSGDTGRELSRQIVLSKDKMDQVHREK